MAANVHEVTDASFQSDVLESPELVMVDFWAPWCGPCLAMAPIVEQLASESGPKVKFVKVNVDDNPQIAQTYRVQGIPTFSFFKGGQRVGDVVGKQNKDALQRKIIELA